MRRLDEDPGRRGLQRQGRRLRRQGRRARQDVRTARRDDKIVYVAAPERHDVRLRGDALRLDGHRPRLRLDPPPLLGRRASSPGRTSRRKRPRRPARRSARGWRLCTGAEWFDVCNGCPATRLPLRQHLHRHARATATTITQPEPRRPPIPTGSATMCISDQSHGGGRRVLRHERQRQGVGHHRRRAARRRPAPTSCAAAPTTSPSFVDNSVTPAVTTAPGLQCDASTPAPSVPVRLPSVGFRCCRTGMLPP